MNHTKVKSLGTDASEVFNRAGREVGNWLRFLLLFICNTVLVFLTFADVVFTGLSWFVNSNGYRVRVMMRWLRLYHRFREKKSKEPIFTPSIEYRIEEYRRS